jgi:hypothetical protein
MICFDIMQLARFDRVDHRVRGERRNGCSRGAANEKAYVAIKLATRLYDTEVLRD